MLFLLPIGLIKELRLLKTGEYMLGEIRGPLNGVPSPKLKLAEEGELLPSEGKV